MQEIRIIVLVKMVQEFN